MQYWGITLITFLRNWIPTPISRQLCALIWHPSQCFSQFLKLLESATDVFDQTSPQNTVLISTFATEMMLKLVIGPRVVQFHGVIVLVNLYRPLPARPISKSLARLLPKLYSTRSNYYYLSCRTSL